LVPSAQLPDNGSIHIRFWDLTTAHSLCELFTVSPTWSRHFEIQARAGREHGVGHSEPVCHDQSFETPLSAKEFEQQRRLLGHPSTIHSVVCTHHAECPTLFDCQLKWDEVQLPEGALIDDNVYRLTLKLLFISHEVLYRRDDALGLYASDECSPKASGEQRVFAIALEIAAAQWASMQV